MKIFSIIQERKCIWGKWVEEKLHFPSILTSNRILNKFDGKHNTFYGYVFLCYIMVFFCLNVHSIYIESAICLYVFDTKKYMCISFYKQLSKDLSYIHDGIYFNGMNIWGIYKIDSILWWYMLDICTILFIPFAIFKDLLQQGFKKKQYLKSLS